MASAPDLAAEPDHAVAPRFRLRLIGDMQLASPEGESATPRSRKAKALLAYVALAPAPVPRERLAALLWGDRGEEQARASLRQVLHELRPLAAGPNPLLRITREHVEVDADALETDLDAIEAAAAVGDARAVARLLDGGDAGLAPEAVGISPELDDWRASEWSRRREAIVDSATGTGSLALDRGDVGAARALGDALDRFDPLSERVARFRLRADHAAGDRAALHRRYRTFRDRLAGELGVAPAQETERLAAELGHAGDPAIHRAMSMEARAEPRSPNGILPRLRPVEAGLLLVVALLAAAVILWLTGSRGPPAAPVPSIAVLPFRELPPRADSYFASGVSEEVINLLARDPSLRVVGSTSAGLFRTGNDPLAVARQLGVTHVLEGSVRSQQDRVVLLVRLVRSKDGVSVWSERYDRSARDIFSVQNEIGTAVARRLAATFSPRTDAALTTTPEVYDRYLAARSLVRDRRVPALERARRLLSEAVALDANFAPAHASLAQVTMLLAHHPASYGRIPYTQARAEAHRHAERAVALAPELGEGHAARGLLSLSDAASLPHYERAVVLDPQRSDFHRWLGQAYTSVGRHREALAQYRRAAALEPLWWLSMEHLTAHLTYMGRMDQALATVADFERVSIDPYSTQRLRLALYPFLGRYADAVRLAEQAARLAPDERRSGNELGEAWAALGENARAIAALPADERIGRAVLAGDTAALAREAERLGPNYWGVASGWWNIDVELLAAGRGGLLLRLYDATFEDARQFASQHIGKTWPTAALIAAMQQAGRHEEADALIELALRRAARDEREGVGRQYVLLTRAVMHALRGDRETALRALAGIPVDAWPDLVSLTGRRLSELPGLKSLAGDARLAALEAAVTRNLDAQRAELGLPPLAGAIQRGRAFLTTFSRPSGADADARMPSFVATDRRTCLHAFDCALSRRLRSGRRRLPRPRPAR